MKLQINQVLHVASMVLLTAFLFQTFANPDPKNRKKTMMATGVFATLMLIGGFGLVARMQVGFPAWIIIKLVCWLGLVSISGMAGGAFAFSVAGEFAGRWLVKSTTNWRARRWQLPYGDQALFLRRETFAGLSGFREMPIMEDYEFVQRLRRLGRIAIASSQAVTSGRR